jgi:hypothetical protein
MVNSTARMINFLNMAVSPEYVSISLTQIIPEGCKKARPMILGGL